MKYVFVSESIILLFAVFLLSITVTPGEAFAEDMLDNKMFVIKISEQGKEGESFDDELTFKEGTFFSSDCESLRASVWWLSRGNRGLQQSNRDRP